MTNDPSPCKLEVLKGHRLGESFTFTQPRVRIGRAADNDLVVNDAAVSRQHAELTWDPQARRWHIRDLGSRNGVLVNGERVEERELADGDLVVLGEHEFRFQCPSAGASEEDRTAVVAVAGTGREKKPRAEKQAGKTRRSKGSGKGRLRRPLVLGAAGVVVLLLIVGVLSKLGSGPPPPPPRPPQSTDPVPLPVSGAFGLIPFKGMDKSHADRVDFTFVARSKKVELTYSTAGVDMPGEVVIYLNGFRIGEADPKMAWTFPKTIPLPPEYLILNGTNTLTFDNTRNPPQWDTWGVRHVSVTDWGAAPCDATKASLAFNLGKTKAETKLVAPDNLVRAYDALRQAMLHWERCDPRPPEYEQARKMAAALKQEMDERIQEMLMEVENSVRLGQYGRAIQALKELLRMFYDPQDPRRVWINEKGEETVALANRGG